MRDNVNEIISFYISQSTSGLRYCWLCQGPVAPQVPSQMVREATPAPLLGVEPLTPATQGTG